MDSFEEEFPKEVFKCEGLGFRVYAVVLQNPDAQRRCLDNYPYFFGDSS